MQLPVQITFRHMDSSKAVEEAIREKAEKLEKMHPQIMSWRVVVENVAAHKQQGKLYSLHIDLKVPGQEVVITRHRDEDIFVALRDAFDAAKHKLEEALRLQRGDVKAHSRPGQKAVEPTLIEGDPEGNAP